MYSNGFYYSCSSCSLLIHYLLFYSSIVARLFILFSDGNPCRRVEPKNSELVIGGLIAIEQKLKKVFIEMEELSPDFFFAICFHNYYSYSYSYSYILCFHDCISLVLGYAKYTFLLLFSSSSYHGIRFFVQLINTNK